MLTPYDKLKSLPNSEKNLKKVVSFKILDQKASELTDNACADLLKKLRILLFNEIFTQDLKEA